MTEIILTSDQTHQLAAATDGVIIADQAGNVVVRLLPKVTDEEAKIIAEARRRLASDQPRRSAAEVRARMIEE